MQQEQSEKFNQIASQHVLMSEHTTYKIGGPAKYFCDVKQTEDLKFLLDYSNKNGIDLFVVGSGSNLLVSDKGYDGLIVKLNRCFNEISYEKNQDLYIFGAGVSLAKIVNFCKSNSLIGYEFLCGIPGQLGGSIKMNAGLKTQWLSDIVKWVKVIDKSGNVTILKKDDITWDYRYSSITDDQIVLEAALSFDKAKDEAQLDDCLAKVDELMNNRRQKQPYEFPSCGSVFKNPKNNFSAQLIEEAGFKGFSVGGAEVSTKHANFIINKGNACASDVVSIIKSIQKKVYDKNNIKLFPEVKFLGFIEECSLF